jgi:integrase
MRLFAERSHRFRGCRPLSDDEIPRVLAAIGGTYAARDRLLVELGCRTGFRVSELLALAVGDVYDGHTLRDDVTVARQHMKGQHESRTVPLNPRLAPALGAWLAELERHGGYTAQTPLFRSAKGGAIHRQHAWTVLRRGYVKAGLRGKLATHTLRKTFAKRLYEATGRDLVHTKHALGHRSLSSTEHYVSFPEEALSDLIRDLP